MISRRTLLRSALLASSGLAAGFVAHDLRDDGYTGTPIYDEVVLKLKNLPPAFNGYRIGFLTDLHLGIWVPQEWIASALESLTKRSIDLLILGGDYIFVNDNPLWQLTGAIRNFDYSNLSRSETAAKAFYDVASIISRFSFPDGTVGVVGNHDHWNSYPLFHAAMKEFPLIRILMNEETAIVRGEQALNIFGVDDFLTGLPTRPPSRTSTPGRTVRMLVSHNPDYVATLLDDTPDTFDIALCGHTHGGQVCLPGVNGLVVPVQDPRFIAGLTEVGNSYIYTSRGLGVVGLPFRLNCPPEVTIVELKQS